MTRTDSDRHDDLGPSGGDALAAHEARLLEACFAAARDRAPALSGDLFARLLADAAAEQPRLAPQASQAHTLPLALPAAPGLWAGLVAAFRGLGGLRLAGGLASATVVGLWLGFAGAGQMALAAGQIGVQSGEATAETWDLLPDYTVIGLDLGLELEG